jgi:hypothetical protein
MLGVKKGAKVNIDTNFICINLGVKKGAKKIRYNTCASRAHMRYVFKLTLFLS